MSMDPNLLTMMTEYMQKTGSVLVKMQDITSRAEAMVDKNDQEKVASFSVVKDRAEKLAYSLSTTRLADGHPIIEGHEAVKAASMMLCDHGQSLNLVELVLNSIKESAQKAAALEVGRAKTAGASSPASQDPIDALVSEIKSMRSSL